MVDNTQRADDRARAAALFSTLAKYVISLRPDQADQLLHGTAKLALVPAGHQIVEPIAGLDRALRLLRELSADERAQLAERKAKLVLLPSGHKIEAPLDIDAVGTTIAHLDTEDEIVKHLDSDKRLNITALKKVASELNIMVPPSIRKKGDIQLHIAQSIVGHRLRTIGR